MIFDIFVYREICYPQKIAGFFNLRKYQTACVELSPFQQGFARKSFTFPGLSASSPSHRGHTGVARNLEARFLSWDWRHGRESYGEKILLNQIEQRLKTGDLCCRGVRFCFHIWYGVGSREGHYPSVLAWSACGMGMTS